MYHDTPTKVTKNKQTKKIKPKQHQQTKQLVTFNHLHEGDHKKPQFALMAA